MIPCNTKSQQEKSNQKKHTKDTENKHKNDGQKFTIIILNAN